MSEQHPNPLQIVIDEFRNLTPDVTGAFVCDSDGAVVATLGQTDEKLIKSFTSNCSNIKAEAEEIDDIENLTIQCSKSKLCITAMNRLYFATVSTSAADPKIINSITRVIVPTIANLLNSEPNNAPRVTMPITSKVQAIFGETPLAEPTPLPEPESPLEPLLPSPPISQFMVEKISGLLVASDTVRIDCEVIAKWSELYSGREISQVDVQTLEGRSVTCKFKPIKEANTQGIIQIPEKILQTLQTGKGNLVMIKPVVK